MIIREYKTEDRQDFERCLLEASQEEYSRQPEYWEETNSQVVSAYFDSLLKDTSDNKGKIFVAEVDNKVVGYVVVTLDSQNSPDIRIKKFGHVNDIAVLSEYRSHGVGAELLKATEKFVKDAGLKWMYLRVSVGNRAVSFYEKNGYTKKFISYHKKLNLDE